MEKDILKLHDKVDSIDSRLDNVDKHLAVYNEQLKIHIKRTELLEKDVAPIKDHVSQLRGVAKFIGYSIAIFGVLIGAIEYLK